MGPLYTHPTLLRWSIGTTPRFGLVYASDVGKSVCVDESLYWGERCEMWLLIAGEAVNGKVDVPEADSRRFRRWGMKRPGSKSNPKTSSCGIGIDIGTISSKRKNLKRTRPTNY